MNGDQLLARYVRQSLASPQILSTLNSTDNVDHIEKLISKQCNNKLKILFIMLILFSIGKNYYSNSVN